MDFEVLSGSLPLFEIPSGTGPAVIGAIFFRHFSPDLGLQIIILLN